MRYFLQCAYDGAHFSGWQRQPNAPSIQEDLEEALNLLLGEQIPIVAAGRTDAGVHARQMYAHFDSAEIEHPDYLVHRLNAFLHKSISVQQIIPVHEEAHARFDATSRSYQYLISREKDPFLADWSYGFYQPLAIDLMNQAAQLLLHHRDFECFSKTHTDVHTFNCTITHAQWRVEGNLWIFDITADRFLRNMVRAITGTLLWVGQGKLDLAGFQEVLDRKNRSLAGPSVPAKGLYLTQVLYPYLPPTNR